MIFGVIALLALGVFAFLQIDVTATDGVKTIVTSVTTLAGIVITGYMGNSGFEKYTNQKYKVEKLFFTKTSEHEEG